MGIHLLAVLNIAMFTIVSLVFMDSQFKRTKRLRNLLLQVHRIINRHVEHVIIVDYKNPFIAQLDLLLAGDRLPTQVVVFSGPIWLYEIKKKTWHRHQFIHVSTLHNIQIENGYLALLIKKKNHIKVVHEVIEHFNQIILALSRIEQMNISVP